MVFPQDFEERLICQLCGEILPPYLVSVHLLAHSMEEKEQDPFSSMVVDLNLDLIDLCIVHSPGDQRVFGDGVWIVLPKWSKANE